MAVKASLFLAIASLCALGLWLQAPGFHTVLLAGLLAWAAGRFYYFLFYVLHAYVDPRLKYSGVISLIRALASQRGGETSRPLE
ncbi:MAG: hypothetical protein QOF89_4051 [Acidobacteriota bacterium]|jgi:hypothetical protein|nr:hypothetical protein [Acidobacteriota bacterium]